MKTHEFYMKKCLQQAEKALANGDPPVGAVVVLNDTVIGEGIEAGKSSGDITNHAEILAIRDAIKNGFENDLSNALLYTTHEPCIMCSYLIRHHKIPHIIFGTSVDYVGGFTGQFEVLTTEEVPKWGKGPIVTRGICEVECRELSRKFQSSGSGEKLSGPS